MILRCVYIRVPVYYTPGPWVLPFDPLNLLHAASPRIALPLILAIVEVEYLAARAKIVRNNNRGSRTDEVNSARPTDAIAYSDSDLHVDNTSGDTLFNGLNSQVFDLLQQSLSNICA